MTSEPLSGGAAAAVGDGDPDGGDRDRGEDSPRASTRRAPAHGAQPFFTVGSTRTTTLGPTTSPAEIR